MLVVVPPAPKPAPMDKHVPPPPPGQVSGWPLKPPLCAIPCNRWRGDALLMPIPSGP